MSAFGGKAGWTRLPLSNPNNQALFAKYVPSKPSWEDYGKTREGLNPGAR